MKKFNSFIHRLKRRLPQFPMLPILIALVSLSTYLVLSVISSPRAPHLKSGRGDSLYIASNKNYSTTIGTKDGSSKIGFSVGESKVDFVLAGSDNVAPKKEGSTTVLFPSVLPSTDLKYTTTPNGVKEEIILSQKQDNHIFLFDLTLKNIVPKKFTNEFIDPTFRDNSGNYQFHFEKPFAVDASGARTNNVLMQIGEDKQLPGKYYVKLIVDPDWLNSDDRTYPISIDPTIVHDTTAEFAAGQLNRLKDTGSGSTPTLETYYQELSVDQYTVGLWHMNEGTDNTCSGGQDICDVSGNGNHGTFSGNTTFTSSSKIGAYATTNDGTGDYITINTTTSLQITGSLTVEAWVNPTVASNFVLFKETSGGNGDWWISFSSGAWNCASAGGTGSVNTGVTAVLNTWTHVALTYNSVTGLTCYVNGVAYGTDTSPGTLIGNTNSIIFAGYPTTPNTYFNGKIDELRISNIARTPEEIKVSASRRPYSTYTSDVIDFSSSILSWNPLTWTEAGVNTGDGETLKSTTSLVAQWNFNETSGTTADNAEGTSALDGTLSGFDSTASQDADPDSSWTANNKRWGAGALQFDGADSKVTITDNALLEPTSLTVESWVKTSQSGTNFVGIIDKYTGSTAGYSLDFPSGTTMAPRLNLRTSSNQTVTGTRSLNDGLWHFIVGTYDGSNCKIYIDGALNNTATCTGSIAYDTANLVIGGDGVSTNYLRGVIDSIRIYSRVLSDSEIMSNYQAGNIEFQTRVGSDTSPDDGSWSAWTPTTGETAIEAYDSNPSPEYFTVALLHGDNQDAATVVADSSLVPKTITVAGNAQIDTAQSKFGGSSILFDGTGDYLSIPDSSDTYFNGDFTIDMWTRFNALSHVVFYDQLVDANNEILLYYNNTDNRIYFYHYTGAAYQLRFYVPWTPSTSTWYHIALVRNGNTWDIYIDGVAGTKTLQNGAYAFTYSNLAAASTINIATAGYLNGWIDEARIVKGKAMWTSNFTPPTSAYDSITQIESGTDSVIKVENTGSNKLTNGRAKLDGSTVGLWHLDETGGSGAYIKDSTANANHGTPTGTSPAQGMSGKSRSLNGSSDLVSLSSSTGLINVQNDYSVEAWIYPTNTSSVDVYSQGNSGNNNPDFEFYVGSGNLSYYVRNDAGTSITNSVAGISTNKWNHIAFTKTGTTHILYINGSATSFTSTTPSNPITFTNTTLGASIRTSTNGYFPGKIDEVRISNTARSADEIAESYRAGRDHYIGKTISSTDLSGKSTLPFYVAADRPGSYLSATIGESAFANYQPDSNTVGLWHLDEQSGSGAYIKDGSGNGNNGTINGTASSAQGQIGKARSFNGSTDYITAPDSTSLRPSQVTVEAWVKSSSTNTKAMVDKSKGASSGSSYILSTGLGAAGTGCTATTNIAHFAIMSSSAWKCAEGTSAINDNKWHYIVGTFDQTNLKLYVDGVLQKVTAYSGTIDYNANSFSIGKYLSEGAGTTTPWNGQIDEVRVSSTARSAEEIRQSYEVGQRTHPITIDFASAISHSDPLSNSSDLTFTLMATPSGTTNAGDNLFKGDKIIVKENYNGTEYIAQGTVDSVNVSTGATTVSSWDAGSTFPSIGYTPNASVFKWQREYWNINGEVQDSSLDAITNLTLRLTDGNEGRTIYLDDLRSNSDYLTTPTGSTITSATGNRYLQYRAILSSFDEAVSATLSAVTLDYVTNSSPATPTLNAPTDTATNQLMSPVLQTTSTDSDSDYLRYKIQLCTNIAMSVGCQTFDQTSSQTGWSGQNAQTSTAYTSGTQATYTIQTPLTAGTTYYWRSYAIDPAGTNTWSGTTWSPYSFTTTTAPSAPTTPYAEGSSNPTGVIDTTPEFSAIHNDSNSDAANYYEIEVNTASDFSGTVMWDTGAVSMTNLASGARSTDVSYAGTTLTLNGSTYYWRIRFTDTNGALGTWSATQNFAMNTPPSSPSLDYPADAVTEIIPLTTLKTTATDTNSDYLRYKIQLCTNIAMSVGCQTFDQTSSQTGWSGQNAQTSTAYTSGTQATYTIQSTLTVNTTYYWRSYSIDPAGSNTWSSTQSTPYSFTTISAPLTATSCRLQENGTDTSITVVWTDNDLYESGYQVQRSVDGGAFSTIAGALSASTTSYTDGTVTSGHTYTYRVAPYFSGPILGAYCTTAPSGGLNLQLGTFKIN